MAEGAKVPKTSEVPEHGVGFAGLLALKRGRKSIDSV